MFSNKFFNMRNLSKSSALVTVVTYLTVSNQLCVLYEPIQSTMCTIWTNPINYVYYMNQSNQLCILYEPIQSTIGSYPTNKPRVFHVETTWKRPFPRRFNVEYTWCVGRVSPSINVRFRYWLHDSRLPAFRPAGAFFTLWLPYD